MNSADHQPRPAHDILEVSDYLTSGLSVSQLDKWFLGPAPQFAPEDLSTPDTPQTYPQGATAVGAALRKARAALNRWDQTVHEVSAPPLLLLLRGCRVWGRKANRNHHARSFSRSVRALPGKQDAKRRELAHVERNIDTLLQNLAIDCQKIFDDASKAVARSAVLVAGSLDTAPAEPGASASAGARAEGEEAPQPDSRPLIRERTVQSGGEASKRLALFQRVAFAR